MPARSRYLAIARDLAFRNPPHRREDLLKHSHDLFLAYRFVEDAVQTIDPTVPFFFETVIPIPVNRSVDKIAVK